MLPVVAMWGHLCGLDITATTAMPDAVRTGLARSLVMTPHCKRAVHVFTIYQKGLNQWHVLIYEPECKACGSACSGL